MTEYLATIDEFRFEREGDLLVVTSYDNDDFRKEYDWPDDLDPRDEDIDAKLHERFYLDLRSTQEN